MHFLLVTYPISLSCRVFCLPLTCFALLLFSSLHSAPLPAPTFVLCRSFFRHIRAVIWLIGLWSRQRGIRTSAPKASLRSFELPFNWFCLIAAYCDDILCSAYFCCCQRVALSVIRLWQIQTCHAHMAGGRGKERGGNCSWVHVYPLLNHLSGWRAADTGRRLAKSEKLCHVCLLQLATATGSATASSPSLSLSLPLFLTRTLDVYLFTQRSEFYFISVYFHKQLLLFLHFRPKQTDAQKMHLKKKEYTYKNALKKTLKKKCTKIP